MAEVIVFGAPAERKRHVRLRPRGFTTQDALVVVGALVGALAATWVIYERLTTLSGAQGFVIIWFASFLTIYYLAVRELQDSVAAKDRTISAAISCVAIALIGVLSLIVGYVIFRGYKAISVGFFTHTMVGVSPLAPASQGGAFSAIMGTLEQVGLATAICVPLGVLTAVFMSEVGGPLAKPVRVMVDAMSGVPSIVAGLFILAIWVAYFHFSGFAASLALSVLMLPSVTRTTEVVLRLVPGGLREASLALGAPEWKTTLRVVLPTARTGIVTAAILGLARVIGETAPLALTAFGADSTNWNALHGPQNALPLFILKWVRYPQAVNVERGWAGALVLMVLVLALFTFGRALGGRVGRKSS
jgi:phosphate transport system permease protein